MKKALFFALALTAAPSIWAQAPQKTKTEGDWSAKNASLKNTPEAELMIRVGDVDNLNFGWAEGYNPFSGRSTDPHSFPWEYDESDPKGTDRIFVPSSFANYNGMDYPPCGADGYSGSPLAPQPIRIPLKDAKGLIIKSAAIQLFIDDFQCPTFCSRFRVWLNGKQRLTQLEDILLRVEQGGPVGKLVTVQLNAEQLKLLTANELTIMIDDSVSRAADGFSVDFVKLLINPTNKMQKGNLRGRVVDDETSEPIAGAQVELLQLGKTAADGAGNFEFKNAGAGLVVLEATAKGYQRGTTSADVYANETNEAVEIRLKKEKPLEINGKKLIEGDKLILNNIQFEQGKYDLLAASKTELDKVAALLLENKSLEIELSGHTSNEGDVSKNVLLSQQRADACKAYLAKKGIHEDRIKAIGYGPNAPLVKNDTEPNKRKNRRVELKITRL